MPSNEVHSELCKKIFGKSYEDVNKWLDEPHEHLNRLHRIKRHDPNEALLEELYENFIKTEIYPQEEWETIQLVARLHIAVDLIDSPRAEELKKDKIIIDQQASRIKTLEEICHEQKIKINGLYNEKYRRILEPCWACSVKDKADKIKDEADKTLALNQKILFETTDLYSKLTGGALFFSDVILRLDAQLRFWANIARQERSIAGRLFEALKLESDQFPSLSILKKYALEKIIWKSRSDGAIIEVKAVTDKVDVNSMMIEQKTTSANFIQATEQFLSKREDYVERLCKTVYNQT